MDNKEQEFHSIFKPEKQSTISEDDCSAELYEDDFTDNDSLNGGLNEKISLKSKTNAAIKIQNWFRKLSSRKKIKNDSSIKSKKQKEIKKFDGLKNEKQSLLNYSLKSEKNKSYFSINGPSENSLYNHHSMDKNYSSNNNNNNNNNSKDYSNSKNLAADNISSGTLKKYDWLDELERITTLTDNTSSSKSDKEQKRQISNENIENEVNLINKYLSNEKLGSVLTYLEGVKSSMDVKFNNEDAEKSSTTPSKSRTKKNSLSPNIPKVEQSPNQLLKREKKDVKQSNANEKQDNLKSPEVESSKEMKKSMKKQYEETISRHLAFIDQLISDKKSLTEDLQKLQHQIQNVTEKYQREMEAREGRHMVEMKKLKDIHTAAEQIKREQWIKTEANRIKELTAKGFEPALQKLIAQHRAEITKLKNMHKEELRICQEDELTKYNKRIDELKKECSKEISLARKEERESSEKEFERKLSEEIDAMNKEKENLNAEIARERIYMEKQLTLQEEEFKKMQINLNKAHSSAVSILKREFETARNEQEKRHENIMDNLARQFADEKEEWGKEFFKKHQSEFEEKEKVLRNKLKAERDKEIDLVLQKMVDEREKEVQQNKIDLSNQIKKLKEKHKQELANTEASEKNIFNNYNEMKKKLFVKESENKTLLSQLSQAEDMIKELNEAIRKRNEEKNKLTDIVRQEVADKMASFESENLKLKQEVCNLKAKFKVDVENIRANAGRQMKLKEDEVEEVHRRVKELIEKRVKIENDLKKERDAAIKRADYIQGVLLEQNKKGKK